MVEGTINLIVGCHLFPLADTTILVVTSNFHVKTLLLGNMLPIDLTSTWKHTTSMYVCMFADSCLATKDYNIKLL